MQYLHRPAERLWMAEHGLRSDRAGGVPSVLVPEDHIVPGFVVVALQTSCLPRIAVLACRGSAPANATASRRRLIVSSCALLILDDFRQPRSEAGVLDMKSFFRGRRYAKLTLELLPPHRSIDHVLKTIAILKRATLRTMAALTPSHRTPRASLGCS